MFGIEKLKKDEQFMIAFVIIFVSTWGVFALTVELFGVWGILSSGLMVLLWPAAKYILPDPDTQPYKEQW